MPESTLRYDLKKLEQALPVVLVNQTPGPKPAEQHGGGEKPGTSSPTAPLSRMWGKRQEEWDLLGFQLGADVDDGLVGRAESPGPTLALQRVWSRTGVRPNEPARLKPGKRGGSKSIG